MLLFPLTTQIYNDINSKKLEPVIPQVYIFLPTALCHLMLK